MKKNEIQITFTVMAGDREATERLAREMIRRAELIDGVTLENITKFNCGGLFPSIDSISFSRSGWSGGVFETIQEPGIAAARIPNIMLQPRPTEHISHCPMLSVSEDQKAVISEVALVQTHDDTSELQHLLEMGFPLATEEQVQGTASDKLMSPASMAKAGVVLRSWIQTPIPPCSFYDNLLDRYDDCLADTRNTLPETGYQSAEHLRGMITQLRYDTSQSLTKKHRWLGYIQGVMCAYGILDVDTERDLTREIFRGA